MKKYLELRYRLMPYTYTIARECCDTGLPMMRALWLHHHDDPQAVARGDQFLWGRDILVSPVVEKGATIAPPLSAARAAGSTSGPSEALDGGREIDRAVDLETMPLHVRAGAIIPMGPVKQYTDEPVDGPADAHRLSGRRRRVHDVRRRREVVRAQARRLDAAGDDVE